MRDASDTGGTTMMLAQLRVKIKSLAEEARIIRREEGRAKGRLVANGSRKREKSGKTVTVYKLVGVKPEVYLSLRKHRTEDVRQEARCSLLAYAFLRGKDFKEVEKPVMSSGRNWKRVAEIVMKFGHRWTMASPFSIEVIRNELYRWCNGANSPYKRPPEPKIQQGDSHAVR